MRVLILYVVILFPVFMCSQYMGTGSVAQGTATAISSNLYNNCAGGRTTLVGTITAQNSTTWTVPAQVNFTNNAFPFASDLYNSCNSHTYANSSAALAALSGSDIVVVDPAGEIITAYIFADNYFELYINGVAVGKDNVPYTQFNSNIVRFKVSRPFTIAMLLVDWEEHLGLGSEVNGPILYHDGDGGMVAVFKDANNNTIAITDNNWKAQTFYTAPVADLTCLSEVGTQRLSTNCSTQDTNNGSNYYGVHWSRPAIWMGALFNDSSWPNATLYSNNTIGVNNKPAYTNFTDIFDDINNDAQFIWSTNVILDNEVIVRYTVATASGTNERKVKDKSFNIIPNPSHGSIQLKFESSIDPNEMEMISITNTLGSEVYGSKQYNDQIDIAQLPAGIYFMTVTVNGVKLSKKIIVE